jgi:predicted amidohydrolase
VVDDGEVLQNYRKVHLWGRETEWFTAGSRPPVAVDTNAGRVAVLICYDLEFPEYVRLAALSGPTSLPRRATGPGSTALLANGRWSSSRAPAGTNKVHRHGTATPC